MEKEFASPPPPPSEAVHPTVEDWLCYGRRYRDLHEALGTDVRKLCKHFKAYGRREKRAPYCSQSREPRAQQYLPARIHCPRTPSGD